MIIRRKCSWCGAEIEEDEPFHMCSDDGDELDLLIGEEQVEEWDDDEL